MSTLKPWLEAGAPPDIEQMLRAARDDVPEAALVERTVAACTAGVAVAGLTHAAGAATLSHSTAGASALGSSTVAATGSAAAVVLKWTLVGVLASGAVAGGAIGVRELTRPSSSAAPTPAPMPRPARQQATPRGQPTPQSTGTLPPAPAPGPLEAHKAGSQHTRTGSAAPTEGDAPLAAEVFAIEQARSRLAAGNPQATLQALDDYEGRFSERRLAPEALYLRMQAAMALGDTAGARQRAKELVSRYPAAPQVGRAQRLLSEPNP